MKSKAQKLRDYNYYGLAHRGSIDLTHPAIKVLLGLFNESKKILDMGCREGTRLAVLAKNSRTQHKQLIGVDASKIAVKLAKEKYPKMHFLTGNLQRLPFKEGEFDLLYSSYVFEHLTNPEQVLIEAKRVLEKDGILMIIAPNFGSPNRRSPNFLEPKIKKLVNGFLRDVKLARTDRLQSLHWQAVTPVNDKYTIDADTTVEPYLLTLIQYSKSLGFKVEYFSSSWLINRFSILQLMFRMLGSLGIYPFVYWGPHLAIVLRK